MPNSSISVSSGDGKSDTTNIPEVTVNKHYSRGKRIQLSTSPSKPVSTSYTNRTSEQIINDQFRSAEAHEMTLKGSKDNVFGFIKVIKVLLAGAMVVGGASFVFNWNPQGGTQISEGVRLMSIIVFCVGPVLALVLDHYLEQGVFLGLSKLFAWGIVYMVVIEEVMAIRAARDPEFADFLMIELAPYSFGFLVFALLAIGYLRSDLKRKRDLMQMKRKEEDTLAKNATNARQLKADNEARNLRMAKFGSALTGYFQTGLMFVVMPILSLARAITNIVNDSWEATNTKETSKPTAKKKAKKTQSKK